MVNTKAETNFDEYLRDNLKDPEFRRKYEIWLGIWERIVGNKISGNMKKSVDKCRDDFYNGKCR